MQKSQIPKFRKKEKSQSVFFYEIAKWCKPLWGHEWQSCYADMLMHSYKETTGFPIS